MSPSAFAAFFEIIEPWFATDGHRDLRCIRKHPLQLLILACLAQLGGVASFDMLEEMTYIPSDTLRHFFTTEFITVGAKQMKEHWVKKPASLDDTRICSLPYQAAGIPGVIGSANGVRIKLLSCPQSLKRTSTGKVAFPIRTHLVAVNHDLQIISVSQGFSGGTPDHVIAEEDLFMYELETAPLYRDFEWDYLDCEGNVNVSRGAMLLCDNGFPYSDTFLMPMEDTEVRNEARFNEMLESLRQDSERCIGVLKQRFAMLKLGIRSQSFMTVDNIMHTCCAIHNFLVGRRNWELETRNIIDTDISHCADVLTPNGSSNREMRPSESYLARRTTIQDHFTAKDAKGEVSWPGMVSGATN